MPKLNIALFYGGKSVEHEVSICSAVNVFDSLDKKKYNVFTIFIARNGKWYLRKSVKASKGQIEVMPLLNARYNIVSAPSYKKKIALKIDIAFPVIHGPNGEDGTIQGLFELMNIPYVGCSVAASALSMEKHISKIIAQKCGIPVLPHVMVNGFFDFDLGKIKKTVKKWGYPVFVKPVRLGSSVGVTKVNRESGLKKAILRALKFDTDVIIEKGVKDAREIVCGVLGGGKEKTKSSLCGEVRLFNVEFYDYKTKYLDSKSHELATPADLPKKMARVLREKSVEFFNAIGGTGFARIDYMLDKNASKYYFCEINTIPGFTDESLFPALWEKTGLKFSEALDKAVKIALSNASHKKNLKTNPFK
jgi:D-alanine-D-alanine ligase